MIVQQESNMKRIAIALLLVTAFSVKAAPPKGAAPILPNNQSFLITEYDIKFPDETNAYWYIVKAPSGTYYVSSRDRISDFKTVLHSPKLKFLERKTQMDVISADKMSSKEVIEDINTLQLPKY